MTPFPCLPPPRPSGHSPAIGAGHRGRRGRHQRTRLHGAGQLSENVTRSVAARPVLYGGVAQRSGTMPAASYRRPLKVPFEARSMLSFGGFGVAQLSMLSLVRCSARNARQAYATRVLSVRLFSAPFLSDFWAKTSRED